MKLTSPAFSEGTLIPFKYTCKGQDISPPLKIEDIPGEAESLVLIVDDPDAPGGTWTHWLVYSMPPIERIEEGDIPGTQGINDFKKLDYGGPCPPSGVHRYYFRMYALDRKLGLAEGLNREELEEAIRNNIIDRAELMGKSEK